jgi:tRNA threonylcarbamoyladenosine modification (KEOPS) complex Cgi121 subunit
MVHFYFLETRLKNEEIISAIKDYKAISVRPELGALEGFVGFCFEKALEDFRRKENAADDFAIEWLCRIACTRNIRKAVEFCGWKGKVVAIASGRQIPKNKIPELGREIKFALTEKIILRLAGEYAVPAASLKKYPLEEILVEKSAVSFLE